MREENKPAIIIKPKKEQVRKGVKVGRKRTKRQEECQDLFNVCACVCVSHQGREGERWDGGESGKVITQSSGSDPILPRLVGFTHRAAALHAAANSSRAEN